MEENNIKTNEMRETFAKRLTNARKMRGLSISELAKRLDGIVSSTSIEKYEKGLMFPQSSSILIALADKLNVTMGDLLRPFTTNVNLKNFSFRKKSKLGKKAEEAIVLKIQQSIEKYFDIANLANYEFGYKDRTTVYEVRTEEHARQAARDLRKAWNLGNQPIALPIILLEEHGVMVIEVDEDPKLFDGTSNTVNGTPVVVLNRCNQDPNRQEEERRRLTLFHEFGHQYLTFPDSMSAQTKEDLCNVFANEMLIPSEVFINLIGEKRKSLYAVELRNIQSLYGISCRALMMKARKLGVITESYYRWFCIKLNKDATFKAYIDKCIINQSHTSRFEQLVIRVYDEDIISQSKAAEYLGLSTAEFQNHLNVK